MNAFGKKPHTLQTGISAIKKKRECIKELLVANYSLISSESQENSEILCNF